MHRFKKKRYNDDQPPGSAIVIMCILGLCAIAIAMLMCSCTKQEVSEIELEVEKVMKDVIESEIDKEMH